MRRNYNYLAQPIKITRIAKNESDYNYDNNFAFQKFYSDFQKFR